MASIIFTEADTNTIAEQLQGFIEYDRAGLPAEGFEVVVMRKVGDANRKVALVLEKNEKPIAYRAPTFYTGAYDAMESLTKDWAIPAAWGTQDGQKVAVPL